MLHRRAHTVKDRATRGRVLFIARVEELPAKRPSQPPGCSAQGLDIRDNVAHRLVVGEYCGHRRHLLTVHVSGRARLGAGKYFINDATAR